MTTSAAPYRRPPTAQEAVVDEIRRAIREGEFPPGMQLLQSYVAEKLGVSRVPVREALKILEGEGRVSYSPHRGYFVAQLSYDELIEIYRIREILEAEAVSASVPRLTDEHFARMREAMEELEKLAEPGSEADGALINEANKRFHFALIAACGMPRLLRMISQLWEITDPYRVSFFGPADNRATVNEEHREMYEAAQRGDALKVLRVMAGHRRSVVKALGAMRADSAVT